MTTPPARSGSSARGTSSARGGSSARVDRATTREIEDALGRGRTTLIVPLGSTEQHGGHLPLATDTLIADALAQRLAARRPEAWVLPALPLGCADEHLGFAGTMSLAESTLHAIVHDLLRSAAEHGFERAFVFSAHGGNAAALARLARELEAGGAVLDTCVFTDFDAVFAAQSRAAAAFGVSPEAAGHHGGEWETSVLAALEPALVRGDAIAAGYLADAEEAGALFYPRLDARVPGGVVGDPRGADAGRGEAYLSAWVDVLEAAWASAFGPPGDPPR